MKPMIEKLLDNLPNKPGIYKMLDSSKKVIYVGKAANIRKRVSSYFSKNNDSIKTSKLVENIKDIQITTTKNEEEALILENTLIKKFKPKYNILLRDDKSYPYILVDTTHKYPLIKFYRGHKASKKGHYFGPYTQVNKVRYMLNLLQKLFKIRSCEDTFFSNRKRPCLQYQINRCDAPCVNFISSENYQESINNSILLLQGKNQSVINQYTKKMENLSDNMKYEEASLVRDKISMIRTIAKPKDIIENQEDIDILTISSIDKNVCIDVFATRNGVNLGNKQFNFKLQNNEDHAITLNSFIKQYYLDNNPPKKIIVSKAINDKNLIESILKHKYKKSVKLIQANRRPYSNWIKICQQNTDDRMNYSLIKTDDLNLLKPLSRDIGREVNNIVCFDVSHMSGSNTQGSSIWFTNQGFKKNLYRRYNLSKTKRSDDYAAMSEMITRRFMKLKDSNTLPDVLVVDGGKGQINLAKTIINDLSIDNVSIFGVVKGHKRKTDNDRVLDEYLNDITSDLSRESVITLQRIRDEAHRFAITGQRQKQLKKKFNSKLDGIEGIGEHRKSEILKYFGGIQGVLKASIDELSQVPKINENLAEKIYKHLQEQ